MLTGVSIGVSRVYWQQTQYLLTDAEAAQHTLRNLLKTSQNKQLDPDAGKAR